MIETEEDYYDDCSCAYCGADEKHTVETDRGLLICSKCSLTVETALIFTAKPCCQLFERSPEFVDSDDWIILTPEQKAELELSREQSEIARLKEQGLMTEDGELTDKYYRKDDEAFRAARESRR